MNWEKLLASFRLGLACQALLTSSTKFFTASASTMVAMSFSDKRRLNFTLLCCSVKM
jgi:Na+/H+ antiporter NhaD/arsenite permease-like protein